MATTQPARRSMPELRTEDPVEMLWAVANSASDALRAADQLMEAAVFNVNCKPEDRQVALMNILKPAIERYINARQKRS